MNQAKGAKENVFSAKSFGLVTSIKVYVFAVNFPTRVMFGRFSGIGDIRKIRTKPAKYVTAMGGINNLPAEVYKYCRQFNDVTVVLHRLDSFVIIKAQVVPHK